jgi:transcriptional regulator with XRE-family HTH domain
VPSARLPVSRLELARRARGWSQSDLAALAGVHEDTVSRLERGGLPTVRVGLALADALDVGLTDLFEPERPAASRRGARAATVR